MEQKLKRAIFYSIFLVLLLPLVQMFFPMIQSMPIDGNPPTANVSFTWKGWWDGDYMTAKNTYVNDSIGFRADYVRLNNQLRYSLFGIINSRRIVEGKNNYLYFNIYTDSYFGRDYIGADSIRRRMIKLKALQDTLQKLGKTVMLMYTPSKEYLYPEYIPNYLVTKRTTTNMEVYKRIGDSLGVNQLDINAYFIAIRDKSKYPLYSKMGIHWSTYGAFVAADTFVGYVERLRHIRMRHPVITSVETSDEPRDSDDDIEKNANLIWLPVHEKLAYPKIVYSDDTTRAKPTAIYIGDSFIENWQHRWILDAVHKDWQHWYYFKEVRQPGKALSYIWDHNWIKELDNYDLIIISYTSSNLPELGDGFIEQAYGYYYGRR